MAAWAARCEIWLLWRRSAVGAVGAGPRPAGCRNATPAAVREPDALVPPAPCERPSARQASAAIARPQRRSHVCLVLPTSTCSQSSASLLQLFVLSPDSVASSAALFPPWMGKLSR